MRLYAYHNGDKHEVDLALFPVELNEAGDVIFTEDQYNSKDLYYDGGYMRGRTLVKTMKVRMELPLVGGDILIATISDWFIQP